MARYKPYDLNKVTLIPISFPDQILPESFEYALNEIVEHGLKQMCLLRTGNRFWGCLAVALKCEPLKRRSL